MKNKIVNSAIVLALFFLLISCSNNNVLFSIFGVSEQNFSEITFLVKNKAFKSNCNEDSFDKLKSIVKKNGFNNWKVFNGILGVDESILIGNIDYPLYYSFKQINGERVILDDYYSPVIVYDAKKSVIYFVLASDFGG